MRIKAILAVLLVSGILALLFFTEQGRSYINFLRTNFPSWVSGFFKLFQLAPPSEDYFFFELSLDREFLKGHSFDSFNATFRIDECEGKFLVNDISLSLPTDCSIFSEEALGRVEVNDLIKGNFETNKITINDLSLNGELRISFELKPLKFILIGIGKDKLELNEIEGEIRKLDENGNVKQSASLEGETIDIENFFGSIWLHNNEVTIRGFSTKIEGMGWIWTS
jgi:hypothetical protein